MFRCVEDRDRLVVSEELICRDEVGVPVETAIPIDVSPAVTWGLPNDVHTQYSWVVPPPVCLHDDRSRWQIVQIRLCEVGTTVM